MDSINSWVLLILLVLVTACRIEKKQDYVNYRECLFSLEIKKIELSNVGKNVLLLNISVITEPDVSVYAKYWKKEDSTNSRYSELSRVGASHTVKIYNLEPDNSYRFQVVAVKNNCQTVSKVYDFKSIKLPIWVDNYYKKDKNNNLDSIPVFNGYIHAYMREKPGIFLIINNRGNVVWYHQVSEHVKMSHYTQRNTFLAIIGTDQHHRAYGNRILEINVYGDTIANILTEDNPHINKTIHHEVLLDSAYNYVVLTKEFKIFDLTPLGGVREDTIWSDGIMVLTPEGNKIWEWTVFDVANLPEKLKTLEERKDWSHANSVSIDTDGNYLISFFHISEIWKVNAKTGELIWKLGIEGDFAMPEEAYFSGQHAVHRNAEGDIMLFDNGIKNKTSRALSLAVDENKMEAEVVLNAPLPKELYSRRMGSAYLIDSANILQTSAMADFVLVTDRHGKIKRKMRFGSLTYRAEYLTDFGLKRFYKVDNRKRIKQP